MSIEKIAAIKAKRLATKRKTIKGDTEDMANSTSSDFRGALDFDLDVTKDILGRERHWRNRTTVLQSSGKVFSKNIFALLQSLKAREEGKQRPGHGSHSNAPPGVISSGVPANRGPIGAGPGLPSMGGAVQQGPVYSRYDQERFRGKEGNLSCGFVT